MSDIGPGDTVQVIHRLGPHFCLPSWAFPPEFMSIWVVEQVEPLIFDLMTGEPYCPGGLRLVDDVLALPGFWPTPCFRKICGPIDDAERRAAAKDNPYSPQTPVQTPVKEHR